MKIAFITEDGKTISRHFGRAPYYLVVEVEDGQVVAREIRDKLGHNQFQHQEQPHDKSQGSGTDAASHDKHTRMSQAISDCDALICRGMGMGAYQSMQALDIIPLVTDQSNIEKALEAFLLGDLEDHTEMLH